jgi:hypothetical protein
MRPRSPSSRGLFPRPNLTMRELIGLVLAFAVSNAFLSWIASGPARRHILASNPIAFVGVWNGLLALYLGFAFLQAWIRSVIRWTRTGDADPPLPRRWTALGVAEATVIGGTMLCCLQFLFGLASEGRFASPEGLDWTAPVAILLIGSAAGMMVLRMWRKGTGKSLTGHGLEPTIEVEPRIEHRETC